MADHDMDPFLQEVLGLFAQEAQEWITQSQAAIAELQNEPPAPRRAQLLDYLTGAMTNLGGSAATVELAHVERAAFAMLPLLDAMRAYQGRVLPAQLAAANDALRFITEAIAAATQPAAGVNGN